MDNTYEDEGSSRMKSKKCLLLCISAAILMTACQPSPEEDIVVNKNEGVLESAIEESSGGDTVKSEDIPETYQDEFMNDSGDVSVRINAKVSAVDGAVTVLRVKPHEITGEEVKGWADVLFGGQEAYEPNNVLTKGELEKETLHYRQLASDRDGLIEIYGSEDAAQGMIDYYNEMISGYEGMYDAAPETYDRKLSDWTFHPYDYYDAEAAMRESREDYESLKETMLLETVSEDRTLNLSAANRLSG